MDGPASVPPNGAWRPRGWQLAHPDQPGGTTASDLARPRANNPPMSTTAQRLAWRSLFIALMMASCWFSFKPGDGSPPALGWDKADHWAGFAALAFTIRPAWPRWPVALGAALLLAWGGAIELIQIAIPGRDGSWGDWLADAIGIAAGLAAQAAIGAAVAARQRQPRSR